ncbi:MAG: M15 family metallopeptidase [Syntrophomonadaceae bacterium]|nr:M15 family metallopeptidase [Syntrophomonadaceae bacterium]
MRTLRLCGADVAKGNLILVNSCYPLKVDMPRDHLVSVGPHASPILLERQAAKMLAEVTVILGCGHQILPVSGYRTTREQQTIYADSRREHGEDFAQKYVALPGCSEHQTGLAVDLAENRNEIDFIRPGFPYTGICGHFRQFSIQYGFIERYPAGREQITRIAHEPWHFRYVGYPHSEMMQERALTLEEYTDYLKQFPYRDIHLFFKSNRRDFEIFYVPVQPDKEVAIDIPVGIPYQISGNNQDGVVVTLWRDRP